MPLLLTLCPSFKFFSSIEKKIMAECREYGTEIGGLNL